MLSSWGVKFVAVMAMAGSVVLGIERTTGEWFLANDVQKYYRCLPFDWYLIVPRDAEEAPERGSLVRFRPPRHVDRFTEEFEIVKIVAGVPGDTWRIENDRLYINEEPWGDLYLMTSINAESGSLDGSGVVPANHVYVLGTNPSSFDSRYWGALPTSQITGKAYVIL